MLDEIRFARRRLRRWARPKRVPTPLVHWPGKSLIYPEPLGVSLIIAPTLIDRVRWDDLLMEEEIFGPLLPVLSFSTLDEAVESVNKRPKPLALYYFGKDAGEKQKVIEPISFGGGCVNDTILHLATPYLAFGGVGQSGMGSYHGKAGFDVFSHLKSILKRTAFPDAPLRYPPFSRWKIRMIKLLLR